VENDGNRLYSLAQTHVVAEQTARAAMLMAEHPLVA